MKSFTKIGLIIIGIMFGFVMVDLICIFSINRPLFAKKIDDYIYVGLFYKTYNCPGYDSIKIKRKDTKLACNLAEKEVKEIVDLSLKDNNFSCAEALEVFYEDNNNKYSYSCIKGDYVVVRYTNGTQETVKAALENSNISILDLDKYNISYYKEEKEKQ